VPEPNRTITVRYFAAARAAAGVAEERLPVGAELRVGELARRLGERHGADLARVLAASSFLVDEVAATPDRTVPRGAVVDVLPPFAGG
jgi:molybdopterin synthase sulfur carrier subunit